MSSVAKDLKPTKSSVPILLCEAFGYLALSVHFEKCLSVQTLRNNVCVSSGAQQLHAESKLPSLSDPTVSIGMINNKVQHCEDFHVSVSA